MTIQSSLTPPPSPHPHHVSDMCVGTQTAGSENAPPARVCWLGRSPLWPFPIVHLENHGQIPSLPFALGPPLPARPHNQSQICTGPQGQKNQKKLCMHMCVCIILIHFITSSDSAVGKGKGKVNPFLPRGCAHGPICHHPVFFPRLFPSLSLSLSVCACVQAVAPRSLQVSGAFAPAGSRPWPWPCLFKTSPHPNQALMINFLGSAFCIHPYINPQYPK